VRDRGEARRHRDPIPDAGGFLLIHLGLVRWVVEDSRRGFVVELFPVARERCGRCRVHAGILGIVAEDTVCCDVGSVKGHRGGWVERRYGRLSRGGMGGGWAWLDRSGFGLVRALQ
jgi:hypothetical protein